jgi:hypothetical protein
MKRLFITGIPASGKSYLANKLAETVGGLVVSFDDVRESLADDDRYGKWVNFYWNQDEKTYLTNTSTEEQWGNLVAQSEGLWPVFIEKIKIFSEESRPVIFECVNILPHLAKKDLEFPGVVLLGKSYEEILKRNIQNPRWGNTKELQEMESKTFFDIERPRYREEAEKYGYPVFETADDAFSMALNLLR